MQQFIFFQSTDISFFISYISGLQMMHLLFLVAKFLGAELGFLL